MWGSRGKNYSKYRDLVNICSEREPQYKVELRLRNVTLRLRIIARDWLENIWLTGL